MVSLHLAPFCPTVQVQACSQHCKGATVLQQPGPGTNPVLTRKGRSLLTFQEPLREC